MVNCHPKAQVTRLMTDEADLMMWHKTERACEQCESVMTVRDSFDGRGTTMFISCNSDVCDDHALQWMWGKQMTCNVLFLALQKAFVRLRDFGGRKESELLKSLGIVFS